MNYQVRHYVAGDRLCAEIAQEVGDLRLSPETCWVAVRDDGEAFGFSLAAVAHDIAWLLRLKVREGSEPTIALALVRAMLGEFAALGLRGFTVFLQDTEAEQKIRTMIAAAGGSEVNYTGVWSSLKFSGQPDAESVPRETIHAVTRPPDVRPAPQPRFIRQGAA